MTSRMTAGQRSILASQWMERIILLLESLNRMWQKMIHGIYHFVATKIFKQLPMCTTQDDSIKKSCRCRWGHFDAPRINRLVFTWKWSLSRDTHTCTDGANFPSPGEFIRTNEICWHVPYKPTDSSRFPVQHFPTMILLRSAMPRTTKRKKTREKCENNHAPNALCTWSIERSNNCRLCTAVWSILPRLMTTLFKLVYLQTRIPNLWASLVVVTIILWFIITHYRTWIASVIRLIREVSSDG